MYDEKNILISDIGGFFYIFKKKILDNKSILSVKEAKVINSNLKDIIHIISETLFS